MTAILERREASLWARFCEWVTSTENRLYVLVRCYHDPYTINSCQYTSLLSLLLQ
jgi:hypothetical protein